MNSLFIAASPFNFAPLLDLSPREVHDVHFLKTISRLVAGESYDVRHLEEDPFMKYVVFCILFSCRKSSFMISVGTRSLMCLRLTMTTV